MPASFTLKVADPTVRAASGAVVPIPTYPVASSTTKGSPPDGWTCKVPAGDMVPIPTLPSGSMVNRDAPAVSSKMLNFPAPKPCDSPRLLMAQLRPFVDVFCSLISVELVLALAISSLTAGLLVPMPTLPDEVMLILWVAPV